MKFAVLWFGCSLLVLAQSSPLLPGEKPVRRADVGAGESPLSDGRNNLYFTGSNQIKRLTPEGNVELFRDNAGGANGIAFDQEGRLVICEGKNRRVVRIEPGGELTVLADRFESKRFNSPNDLSLDSKGRIYFSDPRYGKRDDMELIEAVYRIDAPGQVVRVLGREVDRPNGLLVSPGDEYLYVADNNNNKADGARTLWRFSLQKDGSVDLKSRKLIFDWGTGRGPDGIEMDETGLLYVAAGRNTPTPGFETADKRRGGIYILSARGRLVAFLPIPDDEVTNCAFGGPDRKTLFITAGGNLWSVRVRNPGRVTPSRR